MAVSLPDFNILVDWWQSGGVPAAGPATVVGQAAQIYHYSKPSAAYSDVIITSPDYTLECIIRLPKAFAAAHAVGKIRNSYFGYVDSTATMRYYKCLEWDLIHPGFTNEYVICVCIQCKSAGTWPDSTR